MSTIKVKTADQKLMITAAPLISSGNKDVDFIEFDFDSSWDEFPERYCVFYLDRPDPYQVTIENDRCGIVQAMTENEGTFCFGVWGRSINGNKIKTSNVVEYNVSEGVPTDGATISSWDTFWAEIDSCAGLFSGKSIEPNPPVFYTYKSTSAKSMFQNSNVQNVTLYINNVSSLENFASYSTAIKTVTFLGVSDSLTTLRGAFQNCSSLEQIIGELNATNFASNAFDYAFTKCSKLQEFRIKQSTLSVKIDLSSCSALSRESVLSVLASCRQIDSTQTIKFASAVYSADISEQIMSAVNKGWTVAFGSNTFKPEV